MQPRRKTRSKHDHATAVAHLYESEDVLVPRGSPIRSRVQADRGVAPSTRANAPHGTKVLWKGVDCGISLASLPRMESELGVFTALGRDGFGAPVTRSIHLWPQRIRNVIALVDDDPSVCKALKRLLQSHGLESISFGSAEAFLGRDPHLRPNCLILDVSLKGMSGFDLRDVLASASSNVPVIFLTAMSDAATLATARAGGKYICLTKPVDELLLLSTLENCRKADVPR